MKIIIYVFVCLLIWSAKSMDQEQERQIFEENIKTMNKLISQLQFCEISQTDPRVHPKRYGNFFFNGFLQIMYDFFFRVREEKVPFIYSLRLSFSENWNKSFRLFAPQCQNQEQLALLSLLKIVSYASSSLQFHSLEVQGRKFYLNEEKIPRTDIDRINMMNNIGEGLQIRSDLKVFFNENIHQFVNSNENDNQINEEDL